MNALSRRLGFSRSTAADRPLMRRMLAAGFWFFLAKGLLWLVAPAAIWLAGSWRSST